MLEREERKPQQQKTNMCQHNKSNPIKLQINK